jgi:O-antigen ligase
MMTLSLAVGVLLVLQDRLPTVLKPLLSDDMYTLNSRTELWSKVMDHILAQPILGTGFFASRYLLIKDFSWAGHAHNSFFEVQLTTGLIGLMLLGLFLVLVCREILLTKNGLLLGITIYCLIQGMVNPLLFNPGFAMFALMLALLSAALKRSSTEGIRNR